MSAVLPADRLRRLFHLPPIAFRLVLLSWMISSPVPEALLRPLPRRRRRVLSCRRTVAAAARGASIRGFAWVAVDSG